MSLETYSFEFNKFILDVKEKVLFRSGQPLSITPKAFHLLQVLLENHGHIVEKKELMEAVWADSFVEEGNLTFTIGVLRKVLGDNSHKPHFIETVPRRGYRFIAEVKKVYSKPETELSVQKTDTLLPEKKTSNKKRYILIAVTAVLLAGSIAFGSWYLQNSLESTEIPLLTKSFTSEKLTTNGQVGHAVISSDGKNVIYVNGINSDKQSVWLRQLESGNNVEIISPSEDVYKGLALSPDGNFLYFSRHPRNFDGQADIYRVSIFGGVPTKIINETQGWISVSPDGETLSFVRCYYRDNDFCSLWIADSLNGQNEKKIISRPRPFRIGDNEISPDGRSVTFAVGQSENSANDFGLMEVDINSGKERELTKEKFFNIKNLTWLPNRSGLLITALRIREKHFRVWKISLKSGEAVPLTKDSENYSALSLNKEASLLVSTQVKQSFRFHILDTENPSKNQILSDAATASFSPNGRIIFSSIMAGDSEIWSINSDGSGQRQLTNDKADNVRPIVSADSKWIFFASNRTGKAQVWRMNADGSNQMQITKKEGGFPLFVTPDNQWVYYHQGLDRTIWRASTASGREKLALNKAKYRFAFSPDGSKAAFSETRDKEKFVIIASLADGQTIKVLKYGNLQIKMPDIIWMPDGKNLAYILADSEFNKNTLWIHPLNGETPYRIADLGDEEISDTSGFAVSPDGKKFTITQGGWKHDAVLLSGLK